MASKLVLVCVAISCRLYPLAQICHYKYDIIRGVAVVHYMVVKKRCKDGLLYACNFTPCSFFGYLAYWPHRDSIVYLINKPADKESYTVNMFNFPPTANLATLLMNT